MQPHKTNHINSGSSPWVKICGLTDPGNALECANSGADAIGLVFFKKSPRNVTLDQAAKISSALPDHIATIGVFVDEPFEKIMEKVKQCHLKGVQLHGNEPPDLIDRLQKEGLIVIKALFAAKKPFLNQADAFPSASFFLIECGKGVLPGGNAESWNYGLSCQIKTGTPIILAGGLSPDNIRQVLKDTNPAGIDVSSGVEKSYGIKDLNKVRSFIRRIKT